LLVGSAIAPIRAAHVMGIVSPDAVPGGSDADGTWAALIGAMADPTNNLS